MKCPYCNENMVKGRTSLANGAAENNSAVYVYKCEKCKKIIIDYSSQDK